MTSIEESTTDNKSDCTIKDEKSNRSTQDTVQKEEEPYTIFPTSRLVQFLIITSLTGMISPLTGSIYFPSVNQIEQVNQSFTIKYLKIILLTISLFIYIGSRY
jgi:hypothetical protein